MSRPALSTRAAMISRGTVRSYLTRRPKENGTHKLPVKADVRKAIGKDAGYRVTVYLEERLDA